MKSQHLVYLPLALGSGLQVISANNT